jgi:hypothetical protein
MEFNSMSPEAQKTAKGMIAYCINNRIGMGMDEGLTFDDDLEITGSQPFRKELEQFSEGH